MKTEVDDWCAELEAPHEAFSCAFSQTDNDKSSTPAATISTAMPSLPNGAAQFNLEEQLTLTRAWIAATLSLDGQDSQEFWTKIHVDYTDNLSLTGRPKTAEELREQWEEMHPHLVEFLTLFVEKWSKCQINLRYALARRKEAFKCAKAAFRDKNKRFGDWDSAWELVNHEKWHNVLRPRITQHGVSSFENESGRQTRTKSRREDGEEARDRRVKPRLDVDGPQQRVTSSQSVTLADEIELKRVVAQGIQLELGIMTRTEDGLAAEAVEYLHLRRLQILQKLRAQVGRRQWL